MVDDGLLYWIEHTVLDQAFHCYDLRPITLDRQQHAAIYRLAVQEHRASAALTCIATILGAGQRGFCDGLSRRNFLRIGALGLGGLSMPEMLQAAGSSAGHKSVIMIYLPGGPP